MLFWSIIFLILAWGAAIVAFGAIEGPLAWTGKILLTAFIAAFLTSFLRWFANSVEPVSADHASADHVSAENQPSQENPPIP